VTTTSEPSWIAPFTGLSPSAFGKPVAQLRREGADASGRGRPWRLSLEDRVPLVTAYWRTNLTLRQLALLFGVSKAVEELPLLHQPSGGHRRRHPTGGRGRPAAAGESQRLPSLGRVRRQGRSREHHYDRRRRLSGKQARNKSHKQVRTRVEHVFGRMKAWKILRDCLLRGDGVHHAISCIARIRRHRCLQACSGNVRRTPRPCREARFAREP
jgi:hypothetical protein